MQHLYRLNTFISHDLDKSYFLVILVATTRKQENKIMNGLLGLKTPLLEIGKRPLLCCSVETCT